MFWYNFKNVRFGTGWVGGGDFTFFVNSQRINYHVSPMSTLAAEIHQKGLTIRAINDRIITRVAKKLQISHSRHYNNLYIGPYLYGKESQQTISYRFNSDGDGYKYYTEYFNMLWNSDMMVSLETVKEEIQHG